MNEQAIESATDAVMHELALKPDARNRALCRRRSSSAGPGT